MLDPHNLLSQVEPDLVKVLQIAYASSPTFVVVYGIRTLAEEKQALHSGHSTTLHSRHLPDKNGLAAAVDVAAIKNGEPWWAPGQEATVFGDIARNIKAAASTLSVNIQWGGDWITFKDWGHYQLPWEEYP